MNAPSTDSRATTASTEPAAFKLNIDNIQVHGFSHINPQDMLQAFQHEFTRLIEQEKLPDIASSLNLETLRLGTLQLPQHVSAQTLGERLANKLYHNLPL